MDHAPMLRTEKGKPDSTARHVLQVLAEHAHKDGTNAYPSVRRIRYRTGYDRRTVQRALRRLEDAKLITAYGMVNGCTRWRLSMDLVRPESDMAELEAEEEAERAATAERVRKHRAQRVTHSTPVTEGDVTDSATVRNALKVRDVTHSDDVRNALSAARTSSEPPVEPPENRQASAEPPPSAQTIVTEWLDRAERRPPSSVVGQVSKQIKALLADGIDPDDVRRGLARWMAKGLHPSVLPSVVNEVMNATPQQRTGGHRPYSSRTGSTGSTDYSEYEEGF
jgi:DNA-binding transcriptional ArsR family regulator